MRGSASASGRTSTMPRPGPHLLGRRAGCRSPRRRRTRCSRELAAFANASLGRRRPPPRAIGSRPEDSRHPQADRHAPASGEVLDQRGERRTLRVCRLLGHPKSSSRMWRRSARIWVSTTCRMAAQRRRGRSRSGAGASGPRAPSDVTDWVSPSPGSARPAGCAPRAGSTPRRDAPWGVRCYCRLALRQVRSTDSHVRSFRPRPSGPVPSSDEGLGCLTLTALFFRSATSTAGDEPTTFRLQRGHSRQTVGASGIAG